LENAPSAEPLSIAKSVTQSFWLPSTTQRPLGRTVAVFTELPTTQNNPMRRITLKRLFVAAAIVTLVLIQAYLESSLGFTPNH
jgi:hypothetical protein